MRTTCFLTPVVTVILLLGCLSNGVAQNTVKPTVKAPNGFDVNSFSGNLYHQRTDMKMPAQGIPMEIVFSYNNTQRNKDWGYGRGWTFTYNVAYSVDSLNNIIVLRADGRRDLFTKSGASYKAPVGVFDTLAEYQPGKFRLNTKEGWSYYFDMATHRKLTKVTDRNNNTLTIGYTDSLPASITDAAGRSFALTWSNGKLMEIQNTCASPVRKIAFSYDTSGNPVKVMSPDSSTLQYYYDNNSRIIGFTDELGNNMSITYNGNGAVSKIVSCATTQLFTYSPHTRKTFVTEQVQGQRQITTYHYDTTGRIIHKEGNCCGYNVAYQYDADNNVSAQTNGNNQTTQYVYDAKGNVVKETDAEGHTMTFTWHPTLNKVLTVKDKRGNTTSYEYDAAGNPTKIIKPLGITEVFTYDTKGNVLTHKDGNNNTTTYEYNSYGQLTKTTDALNGVVTNTYDGCGNLVQVKDARNNTTSYEYDLQNRVTKITDALGGITKYTYDASGNLSSQTDALNRTTTYVYDGLGRRIRIISPAGNTVTVDYDEHGNKTKVTYANGNSVFYTYNSRNQLLTERDANGKTKSFEYDGAGNLISETDKRGNITRYEHDKLNRVVKTTNAAGFSSTVSYDANGNRITATDFNGNISYSTYDALNRQIKLTDPYNNTIEYTYDAIGNTITQKDKNNKVWTTEYDALSREKKHIDPLGFSTEITYDANGNQLTFKNQAGKITSYTYDALNRQLTETNPLNETTTHTYDLAGNLKTISHSNGHLINNTYNTENLLTQITDAVGTLISYTYDNNGNRITEKDANNNSFTYQYDKLNRIISITDALGNTGIKQYDENANIISETDRNNNKKTFEYDQLNRLIKETDALGNSTRFEYDGNNNRTRITDAKNNITSYSFDALNRMTRETYADGSRKEYTYDPNGNRLTRKDNNGSTTVYTTNAIGQLIQRSYSGSNNETFTYDAMGRKLTANNSHATITFTYDDLGRILTETLNGKTTSYTYNTSAGTRTITYPGGRVITEARDDRDRLIQISQGSGTLAQFTYDGADRLITKVLGNGITQNYTYDANNRLMSLDCQPNSILSFQYTYDKEGNRLTVLKNHRPTHSEKYAYDKIYQLTQYYTGLITGGNLSDTTSKNIYSYDAVHNRILSIEDAVTKSYTVNNTNAYTRITTNGVTINKNYDHNGNNTGDGINTYSYDTENKLTEVNGLAQYLYDALGRKIKSIQGSVQTVYLYAGNQVIEERNASDVVQKTFVFGTWMDDLITYSVGANNYYVANSPQGSIYAVYNGSNVMERYEYSPYGSVSLYNPVYINLPESVTDNKILYCGRPSLENNILYDNRLRLFDRQDGRFLQKDQLDYFDSYNLYAYVTNNPVNKNDPLGLFASEIFSYLGITSKNAKSCYQAEFDTDKLIRRKLQPLTSRLGIPQKFLKYIKFLTPLKLETKAQVCVDCEDCVKGSLYLDAGKETPKFGVGVKGGVHIGGSFEKCPNKDISGNPFFCFYAKAEVATKDVAEGLAELIKRHTGFTIEEKDIFQFLPNVRGDVDFRFCVDKNGPNVQFAYGVLFKGDVGFLPWKKKYSFSDRYCYPDCGSTNVGVD